MTFEEWGARLNVIYTRGAAKDWPEGDRNSWDAAWVQMREDFPYLALTSLDPQCGCCGLEDPAVLAFDDPRGPGGFEILYPTFRPTHVFHLG